MRNKNGYGSVVKLSGKRRKPYWVRKTNGFNEKGHPIYLTIAYVETREEGNLLLAQFNHDPWNVDARKLTLAELFDLWKEKKMPKLGKASQRTLKAAYNHCTKYANTPYKELKSFHMQETIDECGKSYSTQGAIKTLWYHLDRFALEIDVINKCYSELLKAESVPETSKTRFTDEEIKRLWQYYRTGKEEWSDVPLILIYSGFRIKELLLMKVSDINLEEGTFKGGIKTKAGKNRIVPIHSLIRPLVEDRINQGNEYLIATRKEGAMTYNTINKKWKYMMGELNMDKTPHECRHTFESLLDSAGANRKCIDLMMGHASKDVGNRIYNHKTIQELKDNIELVTN